MSHRLSRAATTAIRYPVVITLVLVFAIGSLVHGQRKYPRKGPNPTSTTPAVSAPVRPAFQGFPIDQPQSIDLEIDENTTAGFSNRERLDQIRDWLLFMVISDAGVTADATNKILFDLPSSRRGYMEPVASFEYGSTRSRVIGNGRIVALVSQTNNEARADELAQVVDQHRKNLGALPSSITVFDYTVDAASNTAQVIRRAELSAREFFTEANGYFETRVSSLNDLERFMRQIDDVTYATLDNGTLVLGGRKVKGRTYRGIRVEDVAAIWQSEKTIKAKQDSLDKFSKSLRQEFIDAWQTYADVVNSLSQENVSAGGSALEKLRVLAAAERGDTFAQRIRAGSDSAPKPATVAYEAARKIAVAYNSGDVAAYNQLVISTRAVRNKQMNDLYKYEAGKINDSQPVSASGFSLDPTYDFEGLSKAFADEIEPALRTLIGKEPSLVTAQDIQQIKSGFAEKNADPFFRLLGKLSKAGLPEIAEILELVSQRDYGFQQARYDGELKGTEVGMVLFYTDLLAKLWALDFMKSAPAAQIADFYALNDAPLSLSHEANINSARDTRLWFGPQNKGFQFAKNRGTSVLFSRTATRVYAASSNPYNPGVETEANAQSAAFLGWWDAHYDEIAHYEPEYERLNEIMKWSVLVGWLNNGNSLSALDFLASVPVNRANVFPEWARRQSNLRFKDWNSVGFYPAGYKGGTTEAMPVLWSDIVSFGKEGSLSGGVSLAGKETFDARPPLTAEVKLPDIVRRSDLNYTPPKVGPHTPNSFSNFEGTNWRSNSLDANRSELIAVAKKGRAFRDGAAELRSDIPVKRTATLNPEGMNVKTVAGNVEVSDLNIARTANGFKVGAESRAMDTGHAVGRRLSVAEDPEAYLKTAPDVEEAFVLEKSGEFLIKMHRTDQWLRVGFEDLSTPNLRWESRVAELGNDADVLRLNWISEAQARKLAQTGRKVRAASENTGVARVDAFLADYKPVDALRALDELPPNELPEPGRLLRRAMVQIARNRAPDAYDNLRQVLDDPKADQLFAEFNARLRANSEQPDGDQFLPVQDGKQIALVYRRRDVGKPLTADEAKAIDLSGAFLFVEDNPGLGNLDWRPGMETRTVQQVLAKDLGEVVRLPRGEIAKFRPAFITDGGGPGPNGATRTRTFRSVRGAKPDSLVRTSTIIPCFDSDDDDPAKRHNEHHSVLCAKRDDKDRPAYVIVAKTK